MRIYLDNCCFNRPFDTQSDMRIKLETDGKLFVQSKIKDKTLELVWSYILDFENAANPFEEKRVAVGNWKNLAVLDISESKPVLETANNFVKEGLRIKDALHLSCAIIGRCDYFLTTDDLLLKKAKNSNAIIAINPIDFLTVIKNG